MIFYFIVILLVLVFLYNVVLYIYFFRKLKNMVENVNIYIGFCISDLMFFIKVVLDMFIYVWRFFFY